MRTFRFVLSISSHGFLEICIFCVFCLLYVSLLLLCPKETSFIHGHYLIATFRYVLLFWWEKMYIGDDSQKNKTSYKFIHISRMYIFIAIWRIRFSPMTVWSIVGYLYLRTNALLAWLQLYLLYCHPAICWFTL